MKKVLALLVAVTMLFSSCSKEKKLNRKLDGKWDIESFSGVPPKAGESISVIFNKDKKEGTFSIKVTQNGFSVAIKGKYTLTEDEIITLTPTDLTNYDILVFTVTKYDKQDLTLTQSDNTVWKLKKE